MSDDALDRKLDALRHEIEGLEPPPSIEQAITAAVRAGPRKLQPRRWHHGWRERWPAWPILVAASIAVVAWTLQTQRGGEFRPMPASDAPAIATEFIPLVPVRDIASDEGAYIVATRMPRVMLADFGLPVNPARAADPVASEFLVCRDGTVLAVRFID